MKLKLAVVCLTFLLLACNQNKELLSNRWNVIDGVYNSNPIPFGSTDLIVLLDKNQKVLNLVSFSDDATVVLPGVNTPNISAKWEIVNDQIVFTIDSTRYFMYLNADTDYSFLESDSTIAEKPKTDSTITEDQKIAFNMISSKALFNMTDLKNAMKIYEKPFTYSISRDTLILYSSKTVIRAVRDKTIEDLLKDL